MSDIPAHRVQAVAPVKAETTYTETPSPAKDAKAEKPIKNKEGKE